MLFDNSPHMFKLIEQGKVEEVLEYFKQPNAVGKELLSEWVCIGPHNNPHQLNAFEAAVLVQSFDLAKGLIKHFNPAANNSLSLLIASHVGNQQIFDLLIQDGRVDLNAKQGAPLAYALSGGHDEIAQRLLQKPDVNAKHWDCVAYKMAQQSGSPLAERLPKPDGVLFKKFTF